MLQDRISRLSSSEAEFNNAATPYNEALRAAGYKEKMAYKGHTQDQGGAQQNKRRRKRKFLYFNPPFSAAVQSNVTKMFFAIIDRCFPKTHPYLGKLFNRRKFKLSYCTTRNVDAIISSHNKKILNAADRDPQVIPPRARAQIGPPPRPKRLCNCRAGAVCPLGGMCLTEEVVYRCDVTTNCEADKRFYIGSCSTMFKSRLYNHNKSFTHERYAKDTTLSSYIWLLKNAGKAYNLKWSIIAKARPYHPLAGRCRLCTREKSEISDHIEDPNCLNIRSELMSTCRHRRRWLLSSTPG